MRIAWLASALTPRVVGCSLASVAFGVGFAQQQPRQPKYAAAEQMPADRVADSYEIYSQLLPGDQIEWGKVPRTQWLIEDVTKAVTLDNPCTSGGAMVEMMNPHRSVRPPADRQADFAEVLSDFDSHCHDRYKLEAANFRVALPVRMLDEQARARFVQGVMHYMPPANDIMRAPATPNEFKGAAGMHSFTAVYFNHAHTLAMTQIGMYCGGLCGMWRWVALEKRDGEWRVLPWVYGYTIS